MILIRKIESLPWLQRSLKKESEMKQKWRFGDSEQEKTISDDVDLSRSSGTDENGEGVSDGSI